MPHGTVGWVASLVGFGGVCPYSINKKMIFCLRKTMNQPINKIYALLKPSKNNGLVGSKRGRTPQGAKGCL